MKKFFTFLLAFGSVAAFCQQGGISITPNSGSPDPSAALDIQYTNKGFLLPRLSQAQRDLIVSPASGLEIYNTDCSIINYNAGTPEAPNWATITASNVLVAGVSIAANPVGAICSGASVTFTATPSNGINSPTYQWQLNGGNIGSNSATYTNSSLGNGDVVTCILSTNQACVTGSPATSNSITMTVNAGPSTPGPISGDTAVCANSAGISYSISPVAGATSYNWTVPGDAAITVGSGSTSITVNFGSDTGSIGVASVNGCGVSSQSSQSIDVMPLPTVSYAGANQTVPVNTTVTLAANTPVSGTGSWSIVSGSGGNIASPSSPASTFTGGAGSYVLSWTISTASCGSSSSNVTITFQLPAGCAEATDGTVWCTTTNENATGAQLCGYPNGYSGTYYAITNAGAAALGMTVSPDIDCATNYVWGCNNEPTVIAGWTGSSCWTQEQEWARAATGACYNSQSQADWPVVHCTDYE